MDYKVREAANKVPPLWGPTTKRGGGVKDRPLRKKELFLEL